MNKSGFQNVIQLGEVAHENVTDAINEFWEEELSEDQVFSLSQVYGKLSVHVERMLEIIDGRGKSDWLLNGLALHYHAPDDHIHVTKNENTSSFEECRRIVCADEVNYVLSMEASDLGYDCGWACDLHEAGGDL